MISDFRLQTSKKLFFIITFVVLLFGFQAISAQKTLQLETILTEAQKQTDFYRTSFRDLLAVETKTFEEFNKKGVSDEKTVVKSNFLVYQSGKDVKYISELRNVFEVNGRIIPNGNERAERFLAELAKASTLENELKKIQSESSKYDKTWEIFGLTLNEAIVLAPNLRPFFEFKLVGTEIYEGNEVFVVSYQQTRQSPFININSANSKESEFSLNFSFELPGSLKKSEIYMRGKLWIDAKTFQLWREERDLTAQTAKPFVVLSTVFEYQKSEFEILVPKRILLTLYRAKKEKGNEYSTSKVSTANFEYSTFKKTNVEIRILDDEAEVKEN